MKGQRHPAGGRQRERRGADSACAEKSNVTANRVVVARDGAEALDYLFFRGSLRRIATPTRSRSLSFSTLNLPEGGWPRGLAPNSSGRTYQVPPGGHPDLLEGRRGSEGRLRQWRQQLHRQARSISPSLPRPFGSLGCIGFCSIIHLRSCLEQPQVARHDRTADGTHEELGRRSNEPSRSRGSFERRSVLVTFALEESQQPSRAPTRKAHHLAVDGRLNPSSARRRSFVHDSADVRPSRMAYFVSCAIVRRFSFSTDLPSMRLDGRHRDLENRRGFFGRLSFSDELQHLALSETQRPVRSLRRVLAQGVVDHASCDGRARNRCPPAPRHPRRRGALRRPSS